MTTSVDAYLNGYDEACQGGSDENNPYRSDNSGRLWGKWRQGFHDALQNKKPIHKKRKLTVAALFDGELIGKHEVSEEERTIPAAPPPSEQR
jgi:ribosome modulation factor